MFLLQASPHLHRFELHLGSCERDEWDISPSDCPYLYLEEVLISGFYGFPLETQIAMYLLSSAKALKKMTLLCRDRGYDHEKGFHDLVPIFPEKEFGRKFKKQAEDACQWLQEVRPQGVRLLLE
ncbi:hypothetical protein GIB67_035453 [Kingdonia uniflora]|uniref:FBD domain-containing protein n=1 Tax=Kingdonia uniflora TaxID=39325 RepID=A0A7J7P0C5_9MAGN|nr:hypothetical protein GIB67_035453 [Kingdonia uniflora]